MSTKLKLLAAFLAVVVLVIAALTYRVLSTFDERLAEETTTGIAAVHGIETSWHSANGGHRLWSVTGGGRDYRPWLEEHIAVVKAAETLMPIQEKR